MHLSPFPLSFSRSLSRTEKHTHKHTQERGPDKHVLASLQSCLKKLTNHSSGLCSHIRALHKLVPHHFLLAALSLVNTHPIHAPKASCVCLSLTWSFFPYTPCVMGVNRIWFFSPSMRRRLVQPEIQSFVSVLRSPVTPSVTEAKRRTRTVSKSATFLATESMWSQRPSRWGETKVQIFGKEKCETLRQY